MNSVTSSESDDSEFVEVDPTGRYGRYNEVLGKGASKTVYRGFDEYDGIEVAWNQVKVYDYLQSAEDIERLYCEIHLLQTLKHTNIMKFYTSWVDSANRNINFITEMFTSGTLRQYRQKHKRVNIRAVKHWCRQILKGLLYLHSHDPPIIHRDLKCDNIFVNGNQGEVKIGDLGLAAMLRQSNAARCVGTPEFMAPEVYAEEYNELVDIYAFGMCILEMVTFEYPYSECFYPAQIYKKVVSGKKPDSLYKVNDPEVRRFIDKCLATVSSRLPASELLKDPFLQTDYHGSSLVPLENCRDFYGIGPMLRQPLLRVDSGTNLLISGYSNYCGEFESGVELEYVPPDFESNEVDEHFENVGITIKGKMREDDGVFLRLRIVDKEGRVRNIYFPFDMESDTALSVAAEMVLELDITDQEVTKIADMINGEIVLLVPEWNSGVILGQEIPDNTISGQCHNCASCGPYMGYLSQINLGSKNLEVLQCSRNCCAEMHGRFEEVMYPSEASEQCVTDGAPLVSSQSDGTHYELSSQGSEDECEQEHEETCYRKEENVINTGKESECISKDIPSPACDLADDYENEIKQELRWLKAKYQMQLRELRDQQLGVISRNTSFSKSADGTRGTEDMVTSKSLHTEVLLPQSLHRATSLPVDAVYF